MARITFPKQTVSVSATYHCKCGHKFTRKNTDWFTENPFNTKPITQVREEILKELINLKRICPKCKSAIKPQKK